MQCPYAFFPMEFRGVGGALRAVGTAKSCNDDGPTIYLNAGEGVNRVLDKVKAAGGEVTMSKTAIGEYGFIGFIKDSEGHKVGLHSMH